MGSRRDGGEEGRGLVGGEAEGGGGGRLGGGAWRRGGGGGEWFLTEENIYLGTRTL